MRAAEAPEAPTGVRFADGALDGERWMSVVADAVARIGAGDLEKVVLARDLIATAESPIDVRWPLRRLAASYPMCWTFHVDGMFGATPEMLLRRERGLVILDPALLRPGRFDRRVVVPRPDVKGREGILAVHVRKIPLAEDVDVSVIARSTPGFSGADLANLVNEAALNAARLNQKTVLQEDFELAKDKVLMGVARKSMLINEHEKRVTAYHEAGHALVAAMTEGADPLHKVTIIPRGMALGVTMQLPVDDRHTYPRAYLEGQLSIMMGGRLAEELFLDTMTTGAGNDIEQATELARKMVCQFGMSSLGPLTFGKQEEQIFLGREIAQHRDYSESTAVSIDEEVRKFVLKGYERAKAILTENRDGLIRIAEALLERESLDASEIKLLIAGHPLEERRTAKVEPKPERPTPATAKTVRPSPIPPQERPAPA